MSERETNDSAPHIRYESGVPIIDAHLSEMESKQSEAERRSREYQEKQLRLNKSLVVVTAFLVVSTITTGVFQLWYMHRQWKLTSAGLSKMGDQIWAAKDAAYAAKIASDTAAQTLWQMQAQTNAQIMAGNTAKRSADTAASALIRGTRPWVGAVGVPVVTQPLRPGPAKGQYMFDIDVTIRNYGPSPALHVNTTVLVSPFPGPDAAGTIKLIKDEEIASCALASSYVREQTSLTPVPGQRVIRPPFGRTLFPNEPTVVSQDVQYAEMGRDVSLDLEWRLFGCTAYSDQFGKTIYHTNFCAHTPGPARGLYAKEPLVTCNTGQSAE